MNENGIYQHIQQDMVRFEAYKKHIDRLKVEIASNCPLLEDIAAIIYDYANLTEIEHFMHVIATGHVTGAWKQDECEYFVTLRSLGDEFIHFEGPHRRIYSVKLAEELLESGRFDEITARYVRNMIEGLLLHSGIRCGCINHGRNHGACNIREDAIQQVFAIEIARGILLSFTKAADTL